MRGYTPAMAMFDKAKRLEKERLIKYHVIQAIPRVDVLCLSMVMI